MILIRQERWNEASQAFEEAASLAHDMPYLYVEARALYEWGRMHELKGEPVPAHERFAKALAIFRRLGAIKDVEKTERALAELVAV